MKIQTAMAMKINLLLPAIISVAMVSALYAAVNSGPPEGEDLSAITTIKTTFPSFRLDQVKLLDGRAKSELAINRKYLHEGAPEKLGNLNFDTTTFLRVAHRAIGNNPSQATYNLGLRVARNEAQ